MTAISETSTYESEITQLETTDLVLGGADGAANRAPKQLANRTKWLYDRIASLTELPVQALPYPTIATSTNKLTVTPAAATDGGTVSIAAGTRLTLAEEVTSAVTGRLRTFTTAAYTSADLVASSTYYLRAQVDGNGDLLVYTQRGSDSDSIPAGLMGTPDATTGGGFDSTVFDVLIAKVVTGTAGSTPTVTSLANAAVLITQGNITATALEILAADVPCETLPSAGSATLGWARTPLASLVGLGGFGTSDSLGVNPHVGMSATRYYVYLHFGRQGTPSDGIVITWQAQA